MIKLFILLFSFPLVVHAFNVDDVLLYSSPNCTPILEYQQPESVDDGMWETLRPYFLPHDHVLKHALDKIFSEKRVTASFDSIEKAGFKCKALRKWNNAIVAKHSKMKGYFFKMYGDDQAGFMDYPYWLARIQGTRVIQRSIDKLGYQHIFKVPKKWIYPLPNHTDNINPNERNFILVCEDMKTVSKEFNYERWRSAWVTHQLLDAVYAILTDAGLLDSVYVDNMPFCKDGKIAFVDTEHFCKWPVPYRKMLPFLSRSNQAYWQSLMETGGKRS